MPSPPETPGPQAEFDTRAALASKEALKRSRDLFGNTRAAMGRLSGLRTQAAPTNDRLAEVRSLVERPEVQERIAAEVGLAA